MAIPDTFNAFMCGLCLWQAIESFFHGHPRLALFALGCAVLNGLGWAL
jgi:hypothetical protein